MLTCAKACSYAFDFEIIYYMDLSIIKTFKSLLIDHRTELIKPATELFRHNLTGTLEASVRATNAQYDENDILQRLDVHILEVN